MGRRGIQCKDEVVTYDGAEVVIKEGYEPRILDSDDNEMGEDLTDSLLAYGANLPSNF